MMELSQSPDAGYWIVGAVFFIAGAVIAAWIDLGKKG